jgi:predicted homoserine dehydrogenase-like protein
MNLCELARRRAETAGPIRVGLIGAGKFGSMFLAQLPTMPGIGISAVADFYPDRVAAHLARVFGEDGLAGSALLTDDADEIFRRDDVEVVIEATGDPIAGISHALKAIQAGKHIVMVNVEADALAGPALAARARAVGVVY